MRHLFALVFFATVSLVGFTLCAGLATGLAYLYTAQPPVSPAACISGGVLLLGAALSAIAIAAAGIRAVSDCLADCRAERDANDRMRRATARRRIALS